MNSKNGNPLKLEHKSAVFTWNQYWIDMIGLISSLGVCLYKKWERLIVRKKYSYGFGLYGFDRE